MAVEARRARALFASDPEKSRGRLCPELPSATRSDFRRDCDRIIHSTAFRRLAHKTQVFVFHEGDHFRTRLTHSLEVAQIARSIARHFGLDEDLTEAIALAHDLGHTPFGHAGQDALNACMQGHGGFEHNAQSLRVVDYLEQRYAAFDGLNLCFETREGILKHCSLARAKQLGEVGQRFLINRRPSLEAQLANLSDEIAYNNHDIEDGLRAGLIDLPALQELDLVQEATEHIAHCYGELNPKRWVGELLRRLIDAMVSDLIATTSQAIEAHRPESLEAARQCPDLVAFSDTMLKRIHQVKGFLREGVYRHTAVSSKMDEARTVLTQLFECYLREPSELPIEHQERFAESGERALADYLAGMTDRFALKDALRLGIKIDKLA